MGASSAAPARRDARWSAVVAVTGREADAPRAEWLQPGGNKAPLIVRRRHGEQAATRWRYVGKGGRVISCGQQCAMGVPGSGHHADHQPVPQRSTYYWRGKYDDACQREPGRPDFLL
jgi:hypothetical protein